MFTTRTGRVLATLALSLMLSGVASAQQPGRGFGGGGLFLLTRPEVQTELKLTDAQKNQITELNQKLREGGQAFFQQLQNTPEAERPKLLADRQAEQMKALNAILTPDQQKRYREISLQQQGLSALTTPAVADELKLTADQKTKIQEINQQRGAAMREIFQAANGDQAAMRDKMQALNRETETKIAALLTDAQKSQWKQLLGTPFNLPPPGGR